ncbi:MAG: type II secretion system F family protein [Thiobacillaceae bacterium]
MPFYRYRAVDQTGRSLRGTLSAVNDVDLELRLKRMGLDLVTLRPLMHGQRHSRERITRRDLITFCFHLEQITRAGIPLLDGLRDLRDSMDNRAFRDILTALLEDLEGGKVLSQALASHPAVFAPVLVHVVRAGEQTGRMDTVFKNLAHTLKWQDETTDKARRLMVYPAFVSVFVLALIGVLIGYLVPQFEPFLKTARVEIPAYTSFMFSLARVLRAYWWQVLILLMGAGSALWGWARHTEKGRWWWDDMQLRLPFLGPVIRKLILARFANYLSLMYRSGVSVLEAMKTGEDIVGNRVVSASIRRAGQQISEGRGLTESFRNLGVFPPLVIRMVRVGETTGALDLALDNVTYFYNREVEEAVDRGLTMLGPILTVILASILGFFALSVLIPVYNLATHLPT